MTTKTVSVDFCILTEKEQQQTVKCHRCLKESTRLNRIHIIIEPLDTHFGSGSIALAVDKANKLDKMNLTLTGIELDTYYYEKAIERIQQTIKQGTLSF